MIDDERPRCPARMTIHADPVCVCLCEHVAGHRGMHVSSAHWGSAGPIWWTADGLEVHAEPGRVVVKHPDGITPGHLEHAELHRRMLRSE